MTTAEQPTPPRPMLRPSEVARRLGVSAPTVIHAIRVGELPAVNVARPDANRPAYRIAPEAVDAYLAARAVSA